MIDDLEDEIIAAYHFDFNTEWTVKENYALKSNQRQTVECKKKCDGSAND